MSPALSQSSAFSIVVALLFLGPGCYEARSRSPSAVDGADDGAVDSIDGSTAADGGGSGGSDAGPSDAAPGFRDTEAPIIDAGGPCGAPLGGYGGPGCSDETLDCFMLCGGDPDCSDACLAADPECALCYNHSLIQCANAAGCGEDWGALDCCARGVAECRDAPGIQIIACAPACPIQLGSYQDCAVEIFETGLCDDAFLSCFRTVTGE